MSTLINARAAVAQSALTVTSKRLDELRSSDRLIRRHSKRQIKQLALRAVALLFESLGVPKPVEI